MHDSDITSQYPNREDPIGNFDNGDNDGRIFEHQQRNTITSTDSKDPKTDEFIVSETQNVRSSMKVDHAREDLTRAEPVQEATVS